MGKKNTYKSLDSWLKSPEGINALGYDNFSYIEGLDDMKKIGFDVHNLKNSLSNYAAAAKKAGFGRIEYITENGGTTVICRPTDMNIKIDDSECPSLEIGHLKDGFYIHNNMPTANNPVFVNSAGGMAGIASAMSISIDEAAKNVSTYADKWTKENLTARQIARKIKTTTRISSEGVTHLNPAMFSKHVVGDYNASLNPQNMDALAVEGQAMLLQQGMTAYYNHSLYEKHLGGKTGYKGKGAPRDEKTFTRQLETILNVARGSDFNKLDNYVKNNFPWIYEYVWKGDLQNFYKSLDLAGTKSGNRITQGGKKEGAPSIIGLGKDLAPLASYTNAGRKIQQNLRYNPNKRYHDAANAKNKTFSQAQYQALVKRYGNKVDRIRQDLYFTGEVNDEDFNKALILMEADYAQKIKDAQDEETKKELKARLGLLRKELVTKGLGKDASFMSATATKDFRGMTHVDYLKGGVSKEVVNEKIKERLFKRFLEKKYNKGKTEEEIAQLVEKEFQKMSSETPSGRLNARYKKEIRGALHSLYGLDSLAKIGTFDFGDGKTFRNIQTIQKLDNNIFTARAGVTDDRTVSSAMADEILGYIFQAHGYRNEDIYTQDGKLKMHIASQQTDISEKNIRDHILRKWNYIVSNADKDEIQKKIQGARHLKEVFKYIEEDDYWDVDDEAAMKYYGASKPEEGLTAFDFLKDVVSLGQNVNKRGSNTDKVYQSGQAFSLYTDKDGKQTIVQNIALPEARERHVFSGDRYQGLGDETHSGSKFDWKVINSMRGQLGQMERMGVDTEAVDAYRTYVQKIESELAHKEFEYKSYVKNLQMITKTYGSDIDQFVKDSEKFGTAEILTLEELMQYESELSGAYENNGYVQGIQFDDKQLAAVLKKRQEDRYESLEKKWGKEELERRGIFSWKDISVLADLGEGHNIGHYDFDTNKFYHSRYVGFGTGDYENKNGYMIMDDIGTENYRIANTLKDYYRALSGPNSKDAAERASRDIMESHKNIAESVERGSIFDKYHTVMGDASSGYLLLSALGNNFEENFKNTYKKEHAPSMIISTQDAEAMLRSALTGDDNDAKAKDVKEAVYKMYAHAFGKTVDEAKGITDINKIIKDLINKYDYSRGGYAGDVLMEGFQFLRNPVIKFAADQLGGGVVFSSDTSIANTGTMRINQDLAAAAKGDMDGDRVAFYIAAMTGDTEAAREALISYYEHLAKNQKKNRESGEAQTAADLKGKGLFNAVNTGDLSKTSSIMDYYTQNVRSIAMNEGAKGAGIYGDLLFAFEKIFEEANINQSASGKNREVFLANMASNVAHTLYQEGIAIKNIKGANGEVLTDENEIANVINAIVTRSAQSHTWTSRKGMTDFLKLLERTSMTEMGGDPKNPLKGVFKGNIIANLGLNNLTSSENDQEIVNLLDAVAKKEILNFKEGTEEYNRLQDDLNRINALKGKGGDLGNISRELLVALITDKELGLNATLTKAFGEDWGDKIVQRYKYIPGKTHDFERMLLEIGGNLNKDLLDEDIKKKFPKEIAMAIKAAEEARAAGKQRASQLREATKVSEFDTSPSKQTNDMLYTPYYGESKDTRPFENLVKELLDPNITEEDKKAKKLAIKQQFNANKDYKELIASQIQGTYSHLASEYYLTTGGGKKLNRRNKEYKNRMEEEIQRRDLDAESIALLKAVGFDSQEAKDFLKKAKEKGAANAAFLATIMEREGGQFIGSEINLAGAGAIKDGEVQLSNQITDAMYKVYDEKTGKTIFHNVDFKNTKDGEVKVPNLFQITDYIESAKALNNAILESDGSFDAGSYLNAGYGNEGDIYQKLWAKRVKNAAKFIAKERKISEEEALQIAEKQFEDLTKELGVENAQFVGDIISQNDKGVMGRHIVHSLATNPGTRQIYEAYRDGDRPGVLQGKSIEEFNKDLLANSAILQKSGVVFGGGQDEFEQLFDAQYQKLVKSIHVFKELKKAQEALESQLRIAQREVDPNSERITELQQKIEEKKKEIEIATKDIQDESNKIKKEEVTDIYGRTYKFRRKDIDKTVEEMTDTSENQKLLKEQEIAAAKDQLADYNVELKKVLKQIMILERESKKEGLSESTKRVLERNMAYGQIDFAEKLGKYAEVYGLASEDINARGSERDKAWLKEMDLSIGSDNLETFREQTNRELDLEERKKSQRFFNYALEQYTKLEKLNTEIRQTTEAKNTAEVEGDKVEVELLSKKIALLEEELQIRQQTLKVEQFSLLDGYSKEADANAKRVAELRTMKEEKEAKKKPVPKQPGGGSGGGDFLGIDSHTARWLSRIMQGGGVAAFIRLIRRGFKDLTNKAKQLDQAMTNLRIVTGENVENARTLINGYAELGKKLGATTLEVTNAAQAWLRQGYDIAQVNDLVTASMYLSKLGMIDTATATQNLTSAMHGFKLEASEAMDVVDKLTALDVKAATTAGDIAQGLSQFANIAKLGGVSVDQAAAYVATIADVNQMSGITVGQSLNFYGDLRG